MSETENRVKRWIELIQDQKLTGLTDDIEAHLSKKSNETVKKHFFKLLLYLSHAANKCNKEYYSEGEDIYNLTCLFCSNLINIPDNNKFVSSLFHIIRYLLATRRYKEAYDVCLYLRLEILYRCDEDVIEILTKITYLWHNAAKTLLIVHKNSSHRALYRELTEVVKYELGTIKIVYEKNSKQMLTRLSSYLDKVAAIGREFNAFFFDFCGFISTHLDEWQICLDKDEKHAIYQKMAHIIGAVVCEIIKESCLLSRIETLNEIYNHFKRILKEDDELYYCFLQLESMYHIFVKPVENLTASTARRIRELITSYVNLTKKYGYAGAVKLTTLRIVQILEQLLMYWENCIKTEKKMFLENNILLETMSFVVHISHFFMKQTSEKCKSCQGDDCLIKKDIYNAVVIKVRCLNVVSKFSTQDLSKDVCKLGHTFLEDNVQSIFEMKQCNCRCWAQLWSTCAVLIYNLGITSECFYEENVLLLHLMCKSVVRFEGVQSKSQYTSLKNPIPHTLHRLSYAHYNQGMYREALIASALNGAISYTDPASRAFRMWANIKKKCLTCQSTMSATMLDYLRTEKLSKELGLNVNLSDDNLIQLCLREAKGLQEAKVDLSTALNWVLNQLSLTLKANPIQYACAVQMATYHSLHFKEYTDMGNFLEDTIADLLQYNPKTIYRLCLEANIEFYIFVNHLHVAKKQTQTEMESTKFSLHAPRLTDIGLGESEDEVPAYTKINVKEDSKLRLRLRLSLKKWKKCFESKYNKIVESWEPILTLRTLVLAGEYSRLYRYQDCEVDAWALAYKLATELQDHLTIIYVTGRSISSRQFNSDWVNVAKEHVAKFKNSDDKDVQYVIAIFWISLADYYCDCNLYDDARELLDEARKLSEISFVSNIAVYLYRLDTVLRNCYLYKESIDSEEYDGYIVKILYSLVNLNEELTNRTWMPPEKYLFGHDILFSATVNLSLRINSLFSFREISAHLVRRLKTAQSMCATIRVTEILKSLCYIDLSREQLEDCEVKIQGLEHILNIESFQLSMNTNLTETAPTTFLSTPPHSRDRAGDMLQGNSSPVFRNKVFDLPQFLSHKNCTCYACHNVSYRYLVFAATHIRAQLYAMQKRFTPALQHFRGAFKMKQKLVEIEKASESCSHERFYILDYVLLLIDFFHFVKKDTTKQKEAVSVARLASHVCKAYKLEHPICMSVSELLLDIHFQEAFKEPDQSSLTVPDASDMDISQFAQDSTTKPNICSTPTTNKIKTKKPATLRRNRTPPLLKLTKVSMQFSDDEDNEVSFSPTGYRRTRSTTKLLRRKILDEEYTADANALPEETIQSRSKSLIKELIETNEGSLEKATLRDIVNKIGPLVPGVSECVHEVVDNFDAPATSENVRKFIGMLENLKINMNSENDVEKMRYSKQASTSNYDNISEIVELFKGITIVEENDCSNRVDAENGRKESIAQATSSKTSVRRIPKQRLTTRSSNKVRYTGRSSSSSSNDYNFDNSEKIPETESAKRRTRRNTVRGTVTNKESQSVKTRKSKEKLLQ